MSRPLILQLDASGEPTRWISYKRAVFYFSKDLVAWSYGLDDAYTVYGGKNRMTGLQSFMDLPSIIAVKSASTRRAPYRVPTLTNTALFRRDCCVCAYCGNVFSESVLTRDHVIPTSGGGKDIWTNAVTACGPCNRRKDDNLLENIDMELLYVPYQPVRSEYLLLMNRNILANQMDFLKTRIPSHSHVHVADFQEVVRSKLKK